MGWAAIRKLFKDIGNIDDGKSESGENGKIGWISFCSEDKAAAAAKLYDASFEDGMYIVEYTVRTHLGRANALSAFHSLNHRYMAFFAWARRAPDDPFWRVWTRTGCCRKAGGE